MVTASNEFFKLSENFLSPVMLEKISAEINQPIEQTKVGLKTVIPTLLVGIVNKGSTKEGAETLYELAKKQTVTSAQKDEVISGIFGGNLNNIISRLNESTGMNKASLTKLLNLVVPQVMSLITSKVKSEHLSPSGLMNFFRQQRPSISAFVPASVANLSSTTSLLKKEASWMRIAFIALASAGLVWWLNSFELFKTNKVAIDPPLPSLSKELRPITAYSIGELNSFMASPLSLSTAQRFRFESLTFSTGAFILSSGAEYEINQVVAAMKKYPTAKLKIEGFTDSTGLAASNLILSRNRAMSVKSALVARGISRERIEVLGMGENEPIESNATENGRMANRRIEFIIKR